MGRKRKKLERRSLALTTDTCTNVNWQALTPFRSQQARAWAEKYAGQTIFVGGRTFVVGGVYIENRKLYFWVDPCDSGLSYFRIDSKIARLLKHNHWEVV